MRDPSSSNIGDYVILKTLGSGSTGIVKLARHAHTGHFVALKFVKDSLIYTDTDLFKKFRREIAVLKLLSSFTSTLNSQQPSPIASRLGVMQLLDVIHLPKTAVLVMEYCSGGDLFDVLVENGCLPEDVVLDYLQQLVHALHFCHVRGVCHRDLKPENILLTDDNRVKLVDFGMSSMHTPGTKLQTACGSPQYCAPEVLHGDPYDGRAADVWSLGVTLFAMTTGGLPFDDDNLHRLSAKIRSGAFYIPPEVPDTLADLLRAMLTVDPAERISLEGVMASSWFQSRPVREGIFVETDWTHWSTTKFDAPVHEPDGDIVRHLVDLGFGNGLTIRRRIRMDMPCKERDFYRALAAFYPVVPGANLPEPLQAPPVLQTGGFAPDSVCNNGVVPVVGRPPPLAVAAAAAVAVPGSDLVRSWLPALFNSLPHEQAPTLAASVVSESAPPASISFS